MAEAIPPSAGHLSITLRIGVTLVEPGENPDEIISRADHAMDRGKQTGRHRVLPFSDQVTKNGVQSVISATGSSGPEQRRQTSGSAWKTLALSRAQTTSRRSPPGPALTAAGSARTVTRGPGEEPRR